MTQSDPNCGMPMFWSLVGSGMKDGLEIGAWLAIPPGGSLEAARALITADLRGKGVEGEIHFQEFDPPRPRTTEGDAPDRPERTIGNSIREHGWGGQP